MPDPFDTFTETARHVLVLAQQEAQQLRQNFIGTEHLLLGIVGEGGGTAARLLLNRGIDLATVRDAVRSTVRQAQAAPPRSIGLTPRAKQVIELAIDESRLLNHRVVGTQHLLLGMIREGQGVGARVLSDLNLDLAELRAALLAVSNARSDAHEAWPESDPEPAGELRQALADLAVLRQEEDRLRRRIGELVQAEQRKSRREI